MLNQVAFWALTLSVVGMMAKGVWYLSEMHKDVQDIRIETKGIRPLENRVLRIETKLGISRRNGDTNMVIGNLMTGDL